MYFILLTINDCLYRFQDFFLNVKDILRKPEDTTASAHNYHELEKDLQDKYVLAWFYQSDLSYASVCSISIFHAEQG